MKLTCDLCGNPLHEINQDRAVCSYCGIEYGPERLQELRSAQPVTPEPSTPEPAAPQPQEKKSGCGIWILIIIAVLDLLVGTHGIVAVFCLLIGWIVSRLSKK